MVTINFQAWKYGDSQNGCHHTSIPLKSRHHSSIEAVAIVPYPICHHMAMDLVTITIVTRFSLFCASARVNKIILNGPPFVKMYNLHASNEDLAKSFWWQLR